MFANITPQDKQAFFSLLDEYFTSRPHISPTSASPASPSISAAPNGGFSLNNVSLSSLNRFMSPGPDSASPPPTSPVVPKTEKDLERERKEKQQEKERMDFAIKLGKGAIRGSTAATRSSLGLVTRSDRMMKALDDRGAGGLVRGANSLAKTADGYLKPAPKNKGQEVVVQETTVVTAQPSPPPIAEKKKGGVSGLMSSKSFGHVDTGSKMSAFTSMWKDPQKVQPPMTSHNQPPALASSNHAPLPPPTRHTAPEPEPEENGGAESQAQAVYDYAGADSGDLSVQTGQILNVLEKTSDDWWTCEDGNGVRGLVPSNYLKEI